MKFFFSIIFTVLVYFNVANAAPTDFIKTGYGVFQTKTGVAVILAQSARGDSNSDGVFISVSKSGDLATTIQNFEPEDIDNKNSLLHLFIHYSPDQLSFNRITSGTTNWELKGNASFTFSNNDTNLDITVDGNYLTIVHTLKKSVSMLGLVGLLPRIVTSDETMVSILEANKYSDLMLPYKLIFNDGTLDIQLKKKSVKPSSSIGLKIEQKTICLDPSKNPRFLTEKVYNKIKTGRDRNITSMVQKDLKREGIIKRSIVLKEIKESDTAIIWDPVSGDIFRLFPITKDDNKKKRPICVEAKI